MRTIVLAAASGILLLSASDARAAVRWRWPWEKPPREDTRPPVPPPPPRKYGYEPRTEDAYFLQRLHASLQEEMAYADFVRRETRIPEVRRFAERTLAETGAFDEDLRRRASGLGVRLDEHRYDARFLRGLHDGDAAVEWLRLSMDVVKRDRAYFASFKENESDRAFHAALVHHWDAMVERREIAKALHDRIRNDVREGRRRSGSG